VPLFERESKHRGEKPRASRINRVILGTSLLLNGLFLIDVADSGEETHEIQNATREITSYLADDGYDSVRDLVVNYQNNTFTFEISDTEHILTCAGNYDYERAKIHNIGQIACVPIGELTPTEHVHSI
jgi:hypothetical protein